MTDTEVKTEIARVEKALANTESPKLKHDYGKYLKRLKGEYKHLQKGRV